MERHGSRFRNTSAGTNLSLPLCRDDPFAAARRSKGGLNARGGTDLRICLACILSGNADLSQINAEETEFEGCAKR